MAKRYTDYTDDEVRDISEKIYRIRLGKPDEAQRMIEKDGDQGQKLRGRAAAYDSLTIAYLKVLDV